MLGGGGAGADRLDVVQQAFRFLTEAARADGLPVIRHSGIAKRGAAQRRTRNPDSENATRNYWIPGLASRSRNDGVMADMTPRSRLRPRV
jgi:hypothetical protein